MFKNLKLVKKKNTKIEVKEHNKQSDKGKVYILFAKWSYINKINISYKLQSRYVFIQKKYMYEYKQNLH
jgi:hypothetical protein